MDDGVYNAVISDADIFLCGGEKDTLGFSLTVNYGGIHQQFSVVPIAKLTPKTTEGDHITSEAAYLTPYVIMQSLRVADVAKLDELIGRPVVVVVDNGFILEIRHFLKPEISLNVRRYIAQHGSERGGIRDWVEDKVGS